MKILETKTKTYKIYSSFSTEAQAKDFADFLDRNKIRYRWGENQFGSPVDYEVDLKMMKTPWSYYVEVLVEDYEKVNVLMEQNAPAYLESLPSDHYIHKFSNQQLLEVVSNAHEWHIYDVAASKLLLKEKGIHLSATEVAEMQLKAQNQQPQLHWGVFAGGYLGIIASLILAHTRLLTSNVGVNMLIVISAFFIGSSILFLSNGKNAHLNSNDPAKQHEMLLSFLCVLAGFDIFLIMGGFL